MTMWQCFKHLGPLRHRDETCPECVKEFNKSSFMQELLKATKPKNINEIRDGFLELEADDDET